MLVIGRLGAVAATRIECETGPSRARDGLRIAESSEAGDPAPEAPAPAGGPSLKPGRNSPPSRSPEIAGDSAGSPVLRTFVRTDGDGSGR